MQVQVAPLDSSKTIGLILMDKPVTAFRGVALFRAFAKRIGFAAKLAEVLPFCSRRHSPLRPSRTPPLTPECCQPQCSCCDRGYRRRSTATSRIK